MATPTQIFGSPVGDFQLRVTKTTPQSAVDDLTVVDYGRVSSGGYVATVTTVPSGETITAVTFYDRGTTNPPASTPSWARLTSDTIQVADLIGDIDMEVTSATTLAPELSLRVEAFNMKPNGTGITGNAGVTLNNDGAGTQYIEKTFNFPPGATVSCEASPMGYNTSNATTGYLIGAVDSSDALVAGGDSPSIADIATVQEEPWCVRMQPTIDNQSQRGAFPSVYLPEFTVPADGIVKLRFWGRAVFRMDQNGSGLNGQWLVEETVTIAATDRIQASHELTVAGATVAASSPGRTGANSNTVVENVSNTVVLDLPTGQSIANVAPTNCAVVLGTALVDGVGIVNVTPTGANPSITVTLGPFVTAIDAHHHYEGFFDNQAGNAAAGVPGYTFTQRSSSGTAITTADGLTFTVASGFLARVKYLPIKGRSNAQFINVGYVEDGADAGNFFPISDDEGNWAGGGGYVRYVDALIGPKTFGFRRVSSNGNGNHDALLTCEIVAKAGTTVLPELFTQRTITVNTAAPNAGGTGYDGVTQMVRYTPSPGQAAHSVTASGGENATVVYGGKGDDDAVLSVTPAGANIDLTVTEGAANAYTGIGVRRYVPSTPLDLTGAHQLLATRIDFTTATYIGVSFRQTNGRQAVTRYVRVADITFGVDEGAIFIWYDTAFVRLRVEDAAALAAGDVQFLESGGQFEITEVAAWSESAFGYHIPTGTVIAANRTVTLAAGTFTTGSNTVTALEGVSREAHFTLPAGQILDVATPPTIDGGASVAIKDAVRGELTIIGGNADSTLTVTTTAQAPGAWITNNTFDVTIPGGGVQPDNRFHTARYLIDGKVMHLFIHVNWTASNGGNNGTGDYYIDLAQFGVTMDETDLPGAQSAPYGPTIFGAMQYHDPAVTARTGWVTRGSAANSITFVFNSNAYTTFDTWASSFGNISARAEYIGQATIPIL